jgi:hypothetical protein
MTGSVSPQAERLVERLHEVEDEFKRELRARHRRLRQSIPKYIRHGSALNLLTAPIIYSVIVPLAVLDLWVTLYQSICFPIYGIARVPRRRYFKIDRHKLAYLNGVEKLNCTFCSYANGLLAYVREVAARTEQYWCPIKHARRISEPHSHYERYVDYGDAAAYRHGLSAIRRELEPERRRSRPRIVRRK